MERWGSRLTLLLLAGCLVTCGKDGAGGILSFGVSLDIDEQTIPGFMPAPLQATCNPTVPIVGNLGPDTILPITFDIRAADELEGEDFIGFARVELDQVTLTIVPPSQSGQTWDFIDSVRLFAQAVGSLEPPVLVAELNPVPNGQTEIVIPGTGVDISEIASADEFEISGEVTGRPPCADVHFVGEADFDVSVR